MLNKYNLTRHQATSRDITTFSCQVLSDLFSKYWSEYKYSLLKSIVHLSSLHKRD